MTILRVVAAMIFLGGAGFGGVYFLNGAKQAISSGSFFAGEPIRGLVGGGYDLAELELLESTLYHVEESYVEPGRVDFEKMFDVSLQAVERRIPTCMFRREEGATMLHVQIGVFQTVMEVPAISSSGMLRKQLREIATLIKAHVNVDDISLRRPEDDPYAQVEYSIVNGVLSTLDPHSLLLPPVDSRQMDEDNKGEFGGLGITIVDRDGKLTVEYPLKDTPAEREGLQPDDHIVRIDGETTINMSLEEAVRKLRGPVGAPVVIHIMRQGLTEPLRVRIVRARIKLNPVESQLLDGGVGWISIKSFHANVDADLSEQLSLLARDAGGQLKGVILDLRGNPGGYLTQAVAVSNRFLPDGVIVSTVDGRGREGARETARSRNTEPNYPIAVLLDSSSASASEIVAGALRNNERAVVIGERSFGKGSVQNLHPFFDQSKLKLTISKYLTPGGRSIQSVGIPADIEMLPVIIAPREEGGEAGTDLALVYWRERVRREADLDKHLAKEQRRPENPAYSFSYLRPKDMRRRSADIDLSKDRKVQFARDILLAAPSSRRPEMLAASHRMVRKYTTESQVEIKEAFKALGIDWSAGTSRDNADLDVRITMSDDEALSAGTYEVINLEVTNRGKETLYQLGAITTSENQILDDGEFFFGKLAPGQTRSFERRVWVLTGYPSEETPLEISFRDGGNDALATHRLRVPVIPKPLPEMSWSWTLGDAASGNGDGVAQVGETLTLSLTVKNTGAGPTAEAFARMKNKSGRMLDIVRGTLEPGYMVSKGGERCAPVLPGVENGTVVGDVTKAPERVKAGDPPTYADGCSRVLAPGETWEGSFDLVAQKASDTPLKLELSLGDAEAYDHASVMRMGFYSYFTNMDEIEFTPGEALPGAKSVEAPYIVISRKPELAVDSSQTTVSGVARDDKGIAHVLLFHGEDKVFFEGTGRNSQLKSVPFSADVSLDPGLNTITVLVTDTDGATSTASTVVFYEAPETKAEGQRPNQTLPN